MKRFVDVEAEGVAATVDVSVGHVRRLLIEHDGRAVRPLHTAPWVDDGEIAADASIPPCLRALSGDFLCAPFAASDIDEAPAHGWPANAPWRHLATERENGATTARFELDRRVSGARVEKQLTLRDREPFLYERHVFEGGRGRLPVANHAMTRFGPAGGRIAFSPKAWAETLAKPLEPDPERGRYRLAYPARSGDARYMRAADGAEIDLTQYPIGERQEDFVMLVEAADATLGWAAVLRADSQDAFLSLKSPRDFPVTMLWFSNGGRDYPPWSGRHEGVLGVEEGRTYAAYGHRASIEANPLSDAGVPTALDLDPAGYVELRNVIGGIPVPTGWRAIVDVAVRAEKLEIHGEPGDPVEVLFDAGFLELGGPWQR